MSLETYQKAGNKHTSKDSEVGWKEVKEIQGRLNGNLSMLQKVFNVGKSHGHTSRVRETWINKSMQVCPMYLTYKDHKGWKSGDGTIPPTRPIASGNSGMNPHLSEILSDVIEPIVDNMEEGNEAISTEDFVASLMELNTKMEEEAKKDRWDGKVDMEGKFEACGDCMGDENYDYDEDKPELCYCKKAGNSTKTSTAPQNSIKPEEEVAQETSPRGECECIKEYYENGREEMEGLCEEILETLGIEKPGPEPEEDKGSNTRKETISSEEVPGKPEGRTKTTKRFLQQKMEHDWQELLKAGNGTVRGRDAIPEFIQDLAGNLVLVGFDAEALYPSMKIKEIITLIQEGA